MASQLHSSELVDIVSEYGIEVRNPPTIEKTNTQDLVTYSKPHKVEKPEVVTLGSSNAKSERGAKPHQGRPSTMERFVSKINRVKTKLATPTE